MSILNKVDNPTDLKRLALSELPLLAAEIRKLIIEVMAINGGHLSSNLGSVELLIALHYVFDSPLDKFIFDTSHQIYTHKILTERKHLFPTIRKYLGLCGFANPSESRHDHFFAGHAGTGLSLALGVAKRRDLEHKDEHVISFLSDAPLSCGLTFEALNNIDETLGKFIILLNDNAMAISNGVGNIHNRILGKFVLPREARKEAKHFFHAFGIHYMGPVDGHDIHALVDAFTKAKNQPFPILLHTLTIKGHGMPKAIDDPITYHGVRPFDPESGKFHPTPTSPTTFPKIFGKHVFKMAESDPTVVAITPAMPRGSCLDKFMEKFPDRCFDVGIAEGHAATFAGGLAYQSNLKVIACIYSTFFQRALDNVFQDVCLQNLPVLFALDRGGFSPSDGTTHHGIYDIGFLNAMPKIVIAQPRDGDLLKDLLESWPRWNKTAVIRYPNHDTEEIREEVIYRPVGKGEILAKGKDLVLIGLGHMCKMALEVRKLLEDEGIEATVVDPIFVKPLDTSLMFKLLLDHHYFVTIEEHSVTSGLGMCVNNFITGSGFSDIQVQNFGVPDEFIEHGSLSDLYAEIGLTPEGICSRILERFQVKKSKFSMQKLELGEVHL